MIKIKEQNANKYKLQSQRKLTQMDPIRFQKLTTVTVLPNVLFLNRFLKKKKLHERYFFKFATCFKNRTKGICTKHRPIYTHECGPPGKYGGGKMTDGIN